jgi:hypothetical protein
MLFYDKIDTVFFLTINVGKKKTSFRNHELQRCIFHP